MQTLTKIGKIQNTHGVKGELIISHFLENCIEIKSWKALMIEENKGSFIPYFIKDFKQINKQEMICVLEEITNPEQAKEILGCNVYAPPTVKVQKLIKNDWDEIIGYFVIEKTAGAIGQIQEITQGVGQEFMEVSLGNKKISIPIQNTWIEKINKNSKTIELNLPDGFLEIFTN